MIKFCHTFAARQLSKFVTTQKKTSYNKDYNYFDAIEQTRIAKVKRRQLVKTLLREGANLTLLARCELLLSLHGNQPVVAYEVLARYYR